MKKSKIVLIIASLVSLASCAKTYELYKKSAFNSTVFDECYYHSVNMPGKGEKAEWNNVDKIIPNEDEIYDITSICSINDNSSLGGSVLNGIKVEDKKDLGWDEYSNMDNTDKDFGAHYKLGADPSFNNGYLSKLYDGRTQCYGFYQESRLQINKTGFATYLPKVLQDWKFFAFSLRGGSDYPNGQELRTHLDMDINLTFFSKNQTTGYKKIVLKMNSISVVTDNGCNACLSFYKEDLINLFSLESNFLNGVEAYSVTWNLTNENENYTDDMFDKNKHHVALMIYEFMMPKSTWL